MLVDLRVLLLLVDTCLSCYLSKGTICDQILLAVYLINNLNIINLMLMSHILSTEEPATVTFAAAVCSK